MAYDLCSSRECNICLLLIADKESVKCIGNITTSLQRCSGCQMVVYCGTDHQRQDWPLHRHLCRAVQCILKNFNTQHPFKLKGEPRTKNEIEIAIILLKQLLRNNLGRAMNFYEEELTSFPAYCAVCYSFRRPQYLCGYCKGVSYCSIEHAKSHKESHQRMCNILKLYYCKHKVSSHNELHIKFKETVINVPSILNMDLVDAVYSATKIKVPISPNSSLINYQHFSFVADFSSVGTLCFALALVDLKINNNAEFRIFIVGAKLERQLWFRDLHTRFIFLHYPNIKCLSLYFIGPELEEGNQTYVQKFEFMNTMRTVNYHIYCGMFENFVAENTDQASMIVAYNCGFGEYPYGISLENTWYMGLQEMILTLKVPIVFTSFTRLEADADYAEFLKIVTNIKDKIHVQVERILKPMKNPYRDLRPLRNWQISDEEDIYYRNGYIQALLTHVK